MLQIRVLQKIIMFFKKKCLIRWEYNILYCLKKNHDLPTGVSAAACCYKMLKMKKIAFFLFYCLAKDKNKSIWYLGNNDELYWK